MLGALALLLGLLVPSAAAQTPDCGPIVPVRSVARGMTGQGLTVSQGTTPEPFDVEVLGVLTNGIGPGRDMIIVEVDSPTLQQAGGIWQGMSGSPVYIGDALLGSVSYGLAFTSSGIGGVTPAEDMIDLLSYDDGEASFASASAMAPQATVTGELAAEIHRRTGGDGPAFSQSGVSLRPLPLPLSLSGLSSTRLAQVQELAAKAGLSVTATGGSSTGFDQVQTTSSVPDPGDNLAVAQSFGDLTSAAVGTATLVCDGHLIGFGHPFALRGPTIAGAATADAITIVPDDTFAPFKLANIERLFGTIDQDRFEGVRADIGNIPRRIPVRSTVTDLDSGRDRNGRTDVVTPDAVADIAAFHLLANIDSVINRIGEGSSAINVVVQGEGSQSGPFTFERGNVFASDFDIAFESIFELLGQVASLHSFRGEDVRIDSVEVSLDVTETVSTYDLRSATASIDGGEPQPLTFNELVVQPGSVIDLTVELQGRPDDEPIVASLSTIVPDDAFGNGFLSLSSGNAFGGFFFDECAFFPEACVTDDESLADLVSDLEAAPRNDQLVATLDVPTIENNGGGNPQPGQTEFPIEGQAYAGGTSSGPSYLQNGQPVEVSAQLDRVVRGFLGTGIFVDSPFCPSCPPVFNRVAGEDRVGTAIATAFYAFGFADTVIVAPADDYPSALVAAPLAASLRAPVLLTADGQLSPGVGDAITQLGATTAIVIAPDGQLGSGVEADLTAAGVTTIDRIAGADRYAVADGVARRLGGQRAWLVQGESADPSRGWPDAVSAGVPAGYEAAPILLTRAGDLPGTTATTLTDLGIVDVSIAGGVAAVSQAVEDDLIGRGIAVERVAGADRYETSYLLAQRALELGGQSFNTWMVTGTAFADALSSAPAVVSTGGVMIMGDGQDITRSPAAVRYFEDLVYTAPLVTYAGGFAAISQMVEEQVFGILIGNGPDGGPPPEGGEGVAVGEPNGPGAPPPDEGPNPQPTDGPPAPQPTATPGPNPT